MPNKTEWGRLERDQLKARITADIARLRTVAEDWFGFNADISVSRASFQGMTTRDIYTKAAHFAVLKEMIPKGAITLTTEQEATLPRVLPHVFRDEIETGSFKWLTMAFDKNATKPEILRKMKAYRKARRTFLNEGLYDGRFDETTDPATVTKAFIAEGMTVATRGAQAAPFATSNFQGSAFPQLWVRPPTQASGEIDKAVGFPLADPWLRHRLKRLPHNPKVLDDELRGDLAEEAFQATLQPVSTFMNSLRERLGAAARTAGGGARLGGAYIQGAVYNPQTLISLMNIFRVYYNFFELRTFSLDEVEPDTQTGSPITKSVRIPGTDETIELPGRVRRKALKLTPAMRHGVTPANKAGRTAKPPDIYRVLYRPWLYAGTPVGKKFERTWRRPRD